MPIAGLGLQAAHTEYIFDIQGGYRLPMKAAALWLNGYDPGPKRVASWSGQFIWYADAQAIALPAADSAATLQYLVAQHPDYIYLDDLMSGPNTTLDSWLDTGIPDSHAQLLYSAPLGSRRVLVYRWQA
jgi:hypothetical protein